MLDAVAETFFRLIARNPAYIFLFVVEYFWFLSIINFYRSIKQQETYWVNDYITTQVVRLDE